MEDQSIEGRKYHCPPDWWVSLNPKVCDYGYGQYMDPLADPGGAAGACSPQASRFFHCSILIVCDAPLGKSWIRHWDGWPCRGGLVINVLCYLYLLIQIWNNSDCTSVVHMFQIRLMVKTQKQKIRTNAPLPASSGRGEQWFTGTVSWNGVDTRTDR